MITGQKVFQLNYAFPVRVLTVFWNLQQITVFFLSLQKQTQLGIHLGRNSSYPCRPRLTVQMLWKKLRFHFLYKLNTEGKDHRVIRSHSRASLKEERFIFNPVLAQIGPIWKSPRSHCCSGPSLGWTQSGKLVPGSKVLSSGMSSLSPLDKLLLFLTPWSLSGLMLMSPEN